MQQTKRVCPIIVGGGIGGLTAAIALHRRGINALVCEKGGELRRMQVGGSIHIWHNAMRVCQDLGIGDAVQGAGGDIWRMEFTTPSGSVLGAWPVREMAESIGVPTVAILRGELSRVLLEAVDPGALRLGAEVTGFQQDDTGVTVQFADGKEERGDLLIGADGLRSTVRNQLVTDVQPRYAGYAVWGGTLQATQDWCPDGLFRLAWGPGKRFAFYHVGPQRLGWFAVSNVPEGGKDPENGIKASLLERFADWAEPTEAIIEATPEALIYRMDMYDLGQIPRWGEGRVTLLGDAAHAMTFNLGQGACQAMEDAFVLARCLSEDSNVPAALRAYETRRARRTAKLAKQAWNLGAIGRWEHPVTTLVRDQLMRLLMERWVWKSHTKDMLYQY